MISCYANEIEMKGFNAKKMKKNKTKQNKKTKRGRSNKALYKMR